MRCDELEAILEGIADGSVDPDAASGEHLATCATCAARLARARDIEGFLATRPALTPSASFTAGVMALVVQERWRTERVVDLGFNLAMAAGVLVILAGAAGLAWSLGFLNVTIDFEMILGALDSSYGQRVISLGQSIVLAAVLLTMALGLWWWAEADSSL